MISMSGNHGRSADHGRHVYAVAMKTEMEDEQMGRANARLTLLEILKILQEKTDAEHPISIMEIVNELDKRDDEGISAGRDAVADMLKDLEAKYPGPGKICCKQTDQKNGARYTYAYYFQMPFSTQEAELLMNEVMLSQSRSYDQVGTLMLKLRSLAGQERLNYLHPLPSDYYAPNDDLERNISLIYQAIRENQHNSRTETTLSFDFNGYGRDKKLHKTKRFYDILPISICLNNGKYYLLCIFPGSKKVAHYRIDLITNMEKRKANHSHIQDGQKKILKNIADLQEIAAFTAAHPNMFYEKPGDGVREVTLRVEKIPKKPNASLTIIVDTFGKNWKAEIGTETDEFVNIHVRSTVDAITSFVLQYIDRVKVIAPEAVKDQVEANLRQMFEKYFEK